MSSETGPIGWTKCFRWRTSLARITPPGKTASYTVSPKPRLEKSTRRSSVQYRSHCRLPGSSPRNRRHFNGANRAFVITCILELIGVSLGILSILVDKTSTESSLSRPPIAVRTVQLTCPVLPTASLVGMWNGFFAAPQTFSRHAEQHALCTSSKIYVDIPLGIID
jgi:hypothetical protein